MRCELRNYIVAFLFAMLLSLIAQPLYAAGSQVRFCEFDQPKYEVKMAMAPTKYIRTKSADFLTHSQGQEKSGSVVGGLGGGEIGYKSEIELQVMSQNDRYCVGLSKVKVVFYGKPEVHIASNFERGSCEYTAVLTHEQKHINTMKKFIREYAPRFKREVRDISRNTKRFLGPMSKNQINYAQEKLQQPLNETLERYLSQILPVLSTRQSEIDTAEEYAAVRAKCKNWDAKLSR